MLSIIVWYRYPCKFDGKSSELYFIPSQGSLLALTGDKFS